MMSMEVANIQCLIQLLKNNIHRGRGKVMAQEDALYPSLAFLSKFISITYSLILPRDRRTLYASNVLLYGLGSMLK